MNKRDPYGTSLNLMPAALIMLILILRISAFTKIGVEDEVFRIDRFPLSSSSVNSSFLTNHAEYHT